MTHRGVLMGFWAAVIACVTFFAPISAQAAPPKAKAKAATTQPVAHAGSKTKKKKHKPHAAKKHAGKKHPATAAHEAHGPKVANKHGKKKSKHGKKKHKATAKNTHAPVKAKAKPVKTTPKPKAQKPTPID